MSLFLEPNPPSTVRVTSQLTDSITIQWDTPAGVVSGYKTILNSASAVDNGLNKIKTFNGLTAGTEYTIKVFSEAEDGLASDYVTNTYYTGNHVQGAGGGGVSRYIQIATTLPPPPLNYHII